MVAGFAAAYALLFASGALAARYLSGSPWSLAGPVWFYSHFAYRCLLLVATGVVTPGVVARLVARASVRAGHADPFAGARRWVAAHPRWTRALTALPLAVLGTWVWIGQPTAPPLTPDNLAFMLACVLPVFLAAELSGLPRAGLRALLAPTVDPAEPSAEDVAADEVGFDAVAVTTESRAAVGAMAALPLVMLAVVGVVSSRAAFADQDLVARVGIAVYVAAALAGMALFRRASRIAVGLDGVRVSGSSRARFIAYHEVDDARDSGGVVELVRSGQAVVRLQLHGRDAARRRGVVDRLRAAIALARESRRDPATDFVASASGKAVLDAAQGVTDYRVAAVSRARLWALVEGPGIDPQARRRVAQALAETGDGEDRARLRVAAERCADPMAREAMRVGEEGEGDEAQPSVRRAAR